MPTSPRPGQKTAMISSTSIDLPEHREQVIQACMRRGVFPIAMEHLPARDDDAITVDTESVNNADIYIGIYAWRYGEVPEGSDISYTEMEFNRAVERGIPILVFTIHKEHALTIDMVEADTNAQKKLAEFKERACKGRIRKEFKSPDDLRGLVIDALADLIISEQQASGEKPAPSFHPHYDIPAPPEPFVAHPYTLLQTRRLVGRQTELNLLTDWVAKPDADVHAARILNIVALGGVGKSALTWHWFNEIAPQEMKPMAGRMWWSFYESDARFENFVARALAYVTRRPMTEIEAIPLSDRESQLLAALDREPFLIVLDGMERLLIAYARMDAAYLDGGTQPPEAQASSPAGSNRKTADPRVGNFLRKLAGVKASRILVSTRLHPADLENKVNGDPLPGCFRRDLAGLADDDALGLWRKFNVTGARDQLLPIFNRVENHPLLIQALAGEVARFRRAPGNFEAWQKAHPDFNPFQDLPLVQVKSHVLEFAMRGLNDQARQVLWTIAAFRMPASYDTLVALLTGETKPCAGELELDSVLAELEDRGLVGWEKAANRYDLHPIVHGVVWNHLSKVTQRIILSDLLAYLHSILGIDEYIEYHSNLLEIQSFLGLPSVDLTTFVDASDHELLVSSGEADDCEPLASFDNTNDLESLTPFIELFYTLIGLERFADAYKMFQNRLFRTLFYRLSAASKVIELMQMIFTDQSGLPKCHDHAIDSAYFFNDLASAYRTNGQPGLAIPLFRRHNNIKLHYSSWIDLSTGLTNLSESLLLSGFLRESELIARIASSISNRWMPKSFFEWGSLQALGLTLAACGFVKEAGSILRKALRLAVKTSNEQVEGVANSFIAQFALWRRRFADAQRYADCAWKLAHVQNHERDFIRAARLQGAAALGLDDFDVANERLHHALTRARQVNFVEEELPTLIALAELRRRQNQTAEARELLDDVWEAAERGPYPLFHADAMNVLAQLERDAGNTPLAIEAATQAYRLAWCDGPPYAYHWGLEAARKHLRELGAPEPEMPPFDPSKFEPMPEVEINPKDEFYVEIDEA